MEPLAQLILGVGMAAIAWLLLTDDDLFEREIMTTNVKVEAHCGTDTEVQIAVKEGDQVLETETIQNGENAEKYVFDDRVITVKEVKKPPAN